LNNLSDLLTVLQNIPLSNCSVFYRLYHDSDGGPLFYSMEDLPGQYIEITSEQFARANSHVKVVNGQLVEKKFLLPKLVPDDHNGQPCMINNVSIICDSTKPHQKWKLQIND
jgi:hypothetical protein